MAAEDSVTEDLILAIEAIGVPEATAAIEELTGAVDTLAAATDAAAAAFDAQGASAVSAGRRGAAAGGKGLMGHLMSMKTLITGLGIYEGVKQFSDFQSTMMRLQTQTGASHREMVNATQGVKNMAVSVGTGPQSLAEAMYHIESAGFRGKKALEGLKVAAKGAKVGGADLTDTTTAMTAVMVAGFHGVSTLEQAMGELNATVGAGDMKMQDLNEALGTGILATMKTLGLQVKDTGAALAVLGDNNIRGSQAATRLRMGLMQLIKPSEQAQEAMKKVGLEPLQLAEDLRKPNGLLVMLKDITKHTKNLTPTEKAHTLAEIFGGGRNSAAMLTLIEQMGRLEEKYKRVGEGGKEFNKDWKETTHTLKFFIDQVKALADLAFIKLGEGIVKVVGGIESFVGWLKKGSVGAQAVTGALIGLGTALVVLLIPAIYGMVAAVVAFTVALVTSPLGLFVLAIMAIGAAVFLLIKHFGAVKHAVADAFHFVMKIVGVVIDFIKQHWRLLIAIMLGPLGIVIDFVTKHFSHQIVDVVKWIVNAAKTVWGFVSGFFTKPFHELLDVAKKIGNLVVKVIEWVADKASKLFGKILGPLGKIVGFGSKVLGGIGGGLKSAGEFLGLAGGTPEVTRSGFFEVGERGPEMVYLPRGSAVQPYPAMSAAQGEGAPIILYNILDGRVLSKSEYRQSRMAASCR